MTKAATHNLMQSMSCTRDDCFSNCILPITIDTPGTGIMNPLCLYTYIYIYASYHIMSYREQLSIH